MPNYYLIDGQRAPLGPLSLKDVAEMHRTGSLRDDSILASDGGGGTRRVEEILVSKGLMPARERPTDPRCPSCRGAIGRKDEWCPHCKASTRDFVDAHLASPGSRLLAFIIDSMLPSGVGISFHSGPPNIHHGLLATTFSLLVAIWACVLYSRGMTPGKFLLGMEVLDENGDPAGFWRMIVREWIAKPLSGLVFGLGYLWILIDDERRGWHDSLCGTHVVVRDGSD